LGSKSSAPTQENDGGTLTDGALYFNTTSNIMYVYDLGTTTWIAITVGELTTGGFAAATLVTQAEGIASNDNETTIPTSAAVKDYVDTTVTAQDLDFQGDSGGALNIDLDSETLDIAGGTGITTTGSGNEVSVAHDAHTGDVTGATALTIANDAVTYAKMQNVSATNKILGRDSSGAGVVEEISPADLLTMLGVEASADVTDVTNVTAAGALMDSECAGLAALKLTTGTFLSADESKLDGIEASATADQTKSDIDGLAITTVGALSSGSIATGFGAIDNGDDTITTESLKQDSNSGSVGISYGGWGTLWSFSAWGKGMYYWESSEGESYPWSCGWIVKGELGFNEWGYIQQGSYTNHRFSGTDFQVYHGISWAGHMSWSGKWRKILDLT
jgi:hypothetical protein